MERTSIPLLLRPYLLVAQMAPTPRIIMTMREIIAMRASADMLRVYMEGIVRFSSGLKDG
jgi:hypothetical protein